jgi:hypothetical protein
LIKDPAPTEEK